MKIHVALLAIMMVTVAPLVPSMAADNRADRFALVIGNAKYPDAEAPLKEPINDAREVADELKRDGFVSGRENLTMTDRRARQTTRASSPAPWR
jgi:hypothetical protein